MESRSLHLAVVLLFAVALFLLSVSASNAGFTDIQAGLDSVRYSSVAWGDYDNDGDLDIAMSGYTGSTHICKIYRNDNNSFTDTEQVLQGVSSSSLAWGDYDNDGDLDLVAAGSTDSSIITTIYRNDNGAFSDIDAGIVGVRTCSLAWGDYDNDGDLDLAIAGYTGNTYTSRIYRNNDNGTFTDIQTNLVGVSVCMLAWGDYDNDGDLDLALAGNTSTSKTSKIYRNDKGSFTDIGAALTAVAYCSLAWADYDNDGDLDLALAGYTGITNVTRIYRNSNGTFTDIGAGLAGMQLCSLAWGDCDNDGDPDIAITGNTGSFQRSTRIYRNDNGTFIDTAAALPGLQYASLAWGDHDNDGDLDLALAGYTGTEHISRIYRNDGVTVNTAPTTPTGLIASTDGDRVILSWDAASDAQTPAPGLSYNLRIGTSPGDSSIFSGMADPSSGFRKIPAIGNSQKKLTWEIDHLQNRTYYWSVQAIDTAYAGSIWADEQSLVVDARKISGYVRTSSNLPVQNICLSTNDNEDPLMTSADGYYELWVRHGWSGTILPSGIGSHFTPGNRSYENIVWDQTDQDYTIFRFSDTGAIFGEQQPDDSVWGDFDNDDDLDLAAISEDSSTGIWMCRIYRNDNGAFTDIEAGLVEISSGCLAWDDYDNDGNLDLAVAGNKGGISTTWIYRNDNGSFIQTENILTGASSYYLAWGDYDNDGDPDIAVGNKIYKNNAGIFTDTNAPITGTFPSWGDYDNDGDLDIAITGYTGSIRITRVYRNDNGVFTDIEAGLAGTSNGSLAWGDYDNDGNLDLAVTGSIGSNYSSIIYRNNNGTFTDINAGLVGVSGAAIAWGDFDNDGDLDLAISGYTGSTNVTRIYGNDNGTFTDINAGLVGTSNASLAWGDYDNDGDLDLIISGSAGYLAKIYRNDYATTANTPPTAPSGLSSSVSGISITFSWNPASDAETTASGLSYNIRVGTEPGKDDVFSGMADTSTGLRKIPATGNVQKKLCWTLRVNKPGLRYYWSVQAVDTSYAGSAWADEQQVTVEIRKISGHIRMRIGVGVENVLLSTNDNVNSATTDVNGYYEVSVPSGWNGSMTPSKAGCFFIPANREYVNVASDQIDQDFTYLVFTDIGSQITGVSGSSIAWGDYDNDGDLDLAISGYAGNMYITRIYRNDNGIFTDITARLIGVSGGSLSWGDYDNDGDLDLAAAGSTGSTRSSRIYRNDNGIFTDINAGLVGVSNGMLAWGDYDNDGDLDLSIAGSISSTYITKIYRNENGTFIDIGAWLSLITDGSLAWGDYDNDGDLDLVVTGSGITRICRNNNGIFSETDAGLVGVFNSALAWGDYDNDGDLDLAIAGKAGSTPITRIYRNDNSTFTDINAGLVGVSNGSLAWTDYDNDGDLDLAVAGSDGSINIARIYRNDNDAFTDIKAGLAGVQHCSLAWGDYDNDGDLDLAIAGSAGSSNITRIYRNDYTVNANIPPTAPSGLSSSISGISITFSWNPASDTQTPASGLSYNIRVGTEPGKDDVFSGMADTSTGLRRLPATGNVQKKLCWTLKNAKPAHYYYWSVQAIDTACAGSPWADEITIVPDEIPPVINSVVLAPTVVAAGDLVHVIVNATDNFAVNSVIVDGVSLAKTGSTAWEGYLTASAQSGLYVVEVTAIDIANNITTAYKVGSYRVAKVVGTSCASADDPVMSKVRNIYLFKFWGRATIIDNDSFWLNDGSETELKVIAPGYADIADNDFVSARGILDPITKPPTLTCPASAVRKLR